MRLFVHGILLFTILNLAGALAHAEQWSVEPTSVSKEIRVESTVANGVEVELIHLPNHESFSISAQTELGATPEMREISREALELTLRGVLSNDFNGAIVVSESGQAVSLQQTNDGHVQKPTNILKSIFAFNSELYKKAPANLTKVARLKRFAQSVWQFVIVETVHAGADYGREWKNAAPCFREFGFALDFKIEPQIFLAKFNPTARFRPTSRNYAFYLEVGYNRALHRVVLATRFRREKGSGGLGLPAVKAELKTYQSDGTKRPFRGKAWYPVSPPIASFVLDSSEHYFAQGLTIGINSGDLVPFSTLTNTFTTFVQSQNSIALREVPARVTAAFMQAAEKPFPKASAGTCSALFGI